MHLLHFHDSAIHVFDRITEVSELDKTMLVNAHNDKGCVYARKGQEQEAIQSFETAIVLDSTFDRPYVNLANVYCKQGKLYEARMKYEKVIKINEHCAAAYNGLGVVCVQEDNLQEAEKYFDTALEKNKYCNSAHINKTILKKYAGT